MLVAGAGADLGGTGSANLLDFSPAPVEAGDVFAVAALPLTLFRSLNDRFLDLTLIFSFDSCFTLVLTLDMYLLVSLDVSGGAANALELAGFVLAGGVAAEASLEPPFAHLLCSTEGGKLLIKAQCKRKCKLPLFFDTLFLLELMKKFSKY